MGYSVTILLSTYNGEKYIVEQIDSLLRQKDVQLHILIRDDGSKDSTLSIVQDYSAQDKRIDLITGKNLGPTQSFLELIRQGLKYKSDFYAFCDQDDVWDEIKLSEAVKKLSVFDNSTPNCYYSNLKVVDNEMNFVRMAHDTPPKQSNRYSCLVSDYATGCTMVFNRCAAEIIGEHSPQYYAMHDELLYTVCNFLGNVVYDTNAYINYRQHQNNVLGMSVVNDPLTRLKKRLKRLIDENKQPVYNNAISLIECFGDLLNENDKKAINMIVNYKDDFWKWISLLVCRQIRADSISDDMRFRFLIFIKRI